MTEKDLAKQLNELDGGSETSYEEAPSFVPIVDEAIENEKLQDEELRGKIAKFIEEGKGNKERIEAILKNLSYYEPHAEEILEKVGVDFRAVIANMQEMLERAEDVDLAEEMFPIAKEISKFKAKFPEMEERIVRRRIASERNLRSLDDEDLMTYDFGEDGWTHIHISPGHTLGDRKYTIMAEDLIKLAEEILADEERQGITATSHLVASKTYSGLLEAMGFTLDGPVSEEERQGRWKDTPEDIAIHKAHVDKKDMGILLERAQMFAEQLKKKESGDKE